MKSWAATQTMARREKITRAVEGSPWNLSWKLAENRDCFGFVSKARSIWRYFRVAVGENARPMFTGRRMRASFDNQTISHRR